MIKQNRFEKFVGSLFPAWGANRMAAKARQMVIEDHARQYEAVAGGRRTKNRRTPSTSANAEIYPSLEKLRNTTRNLVRNNPYVFDAIVRKIPNNVIGYGIVPTPVLSSKPQLKKLKELWKSWADKRTCDYEEHMNFYGIQKMVTRIVAESGECIIRKRIVNDKRLPLPLQLQVLEPDFIDTTKHSLKVGENGNYILWGIEYNSRGKIEAYWLYDEHPGEAFTFKYNFQSQRYPASEIIHVFEKLRSGQARGIPFGVPAINRSYDLDDYQDAQLYRQKIAACWSIFVKNTSPVIPGAPSDDDNQLTRAEPGMIYKLNPGEEVTFGSPPGAEGYREYTTTVLGEIAKGYGMDILSFTGDYSQVNFSSGRMAWLEFHRNIEDWQWQMIIPQFCDRIWEWFEQMAAIYGYIRPDQNISVNWTVPRRQMIDPTKEIAASIEAYQNGLMPWQDTISEMGYNPDEQLEKMKLDKEAFETAGLPVYTKPKSGGTSPGSNPDNNQSGDNNQPPTNSKK